MVGRWRTCHRLLLLISYALVSSGARISVRAQLDSNTSNPEGDSLHEKIWHKDARYACVQKWKEASVWQKYENKYCLTFVEEAKKIVSDHLNFAPDMIRCQSEKYRYKMKLCPLKGGKPEVRISYSARILVPKSCFRPVGMEEWMHPTPDTIRIATFPVLEAAVNERDCMAMKKKSLEFQNVFAATATTVTTTTTLMISAINDAASEVISHPVEADLDEEKHHSRELDQEYYENVGEKDDCVGWSYVGVCTKCLADRSDYSTILQATCYECPPGYTLHRASPANAGFSEDNGKTIHVKTQCVKLVGDERRLIMIRHGESVWNELMRSSHKAATAVGLWIGKDSPLSPLGLRQAQRLANVMKKTNERVYGVVKDEGSPQVNAAREELDDIDLEEVMLIKERVSGRRITDEEMVDNLAQPKYREELDVLLGRRCEDTVFSSSQLARAMDTLLITTMESRLKCQSPWMITHNLQEIEHNVDCTPKNEPMRHPIMGNRQRKSYATNNMRKTEEYIEQRYASSDVSRYLKNRGAYSRARWNDQTPKMRLELDYIFSSPELFTVWGGHSIWFRHLFIAFADLSNPACKHLTEIKLANTAMVSARVRRVDPFSSDVGYALYDCKFIHLGSSSEYKMKLYSENSNSDTVPHPSHFNHGIQQINGWKCCCSRSDYRDAGSSGRRSLELCILVLTEKCSQPQLWERIEYRNYSYSEALEMATQYNWGHNNGPCTAEEAD